MTCLPHALGLVWVESAVLLDLQRQHAGRDGAGIHIDHEGDVTQHAASLRDDPVLDVLRLEEIQYASFCLSVRQAQVDTLTATVLGDDARPVSRPGG